MPGDKKFIENDYNPKPGDMQQGQNGQKGAKTDPHQPMDKKLPNYGKLPHPTNMQQGQNRQQGVKTDPHQPMDNKQNDEKQHFRRNGKLPPQMTCSRDTMAYRGKNLPTPAN